MNGGLSTTAWLALGGPFVIYLLALAGYYVLEGRRERALREEYEGEMDDG
ncbi:hypothetical protein [Halorhabdus amylolytica]|nr:hypothetical protein [Halorhabdus amylolytica]